VIRLVQKNISSSTSIEDDSPSVESPITTPATTRWFDPLVEFHRMDITPPSYIQTNDAINHVYGNSIPQSIKTMNFVLHIPLFL
jgi:hypothetical protein